MLYPDALYIYQCENIVSSFISCEAFGDARFVNVLFPALTVV